MTNFHKVSTMNAAFGNPKGDPQAVSASRLKSQCRNIVDELKELAVALGADPDLAFAAAINFKWVMEKSSGPIDVTQVRDSLCDIHVFTYGAHHFMGIDADKDMDAVIDGVMTRFVKDTGDLEETIEKHAAKGVTNVYVEGTYPNVILKSAKDQPDAPKGKFLKSASFKDTVFAPVNVVFVD